jgi:GH24 family phage-related lysozyme (muramidase)
VAQTSIDDLLARGGDRAPNVRALISEIIKWEGYSREMYVDRRGKVRTGIGHPLPDTNAALALPWCHRTNGRRAAATEIRVAFARARAQAAGHPAPALQRASDLVLPPGFATDLAAARLEASLLPGLRRLCPGFDRCPAPAQRALAEMAFDLGVGQLAGFHNLIAACRRGDFAAAADHCYRRHSISARNVSTRDLFREAAALVSGSFVVKNARFDGGRR